MAGVVSPSPSARFDGDNSEEEGEGGTLGVVSVKWAPMLHSPVFVCLFICVCVCVDTQSPLPMHTIPEPSLTGPSVAPPADVVASRPDVIAGAAGTDALV